MSLLIIITSSSLHSVIRCPVLIIHGTKDEVVPFWHGDELLRSFPPQCRAEPFWVDGLGHNSIELHAKIEYSQRILTFLHKYVLANKKIFNRNVNEVQFVQNYYVPMVVPENERYHPENSLSQSGKVFVNRTWMQHGTDIINEAVSSKRATRNFSRNVVTPDKTSKINASLPKSLTPTLAIERSTSEILAQLSEGKCANPAIDNDDTSFASRFITTRDSQMEDDEDSRDGDVEIEWKRQSGQSAYQSEGVY